MTAARSPRPNIVLIMTDQQRFDTIAAMGYPYMLTPNLDRLVGGGTSFSNMYVTAPSCAPSRASLFSGVYPHTNGVFRNDEKWSYCWVKLLAEHGYRCVNVGKMHTMPIEGAFGFHERHVVENKDRAHPNLPFYLDNWDKALWARGLEKPSRVTYRRRNDYADRLGAFEWVLPEDLHPDVFVSNMACLWLDRYPGAEPFFLQIGLPGPHPPYDPTPEYLAMYADRELPEPIRDYDLDEQPLPLRLLRAHHRAHDHDAIVQLAEPTPEQLRSQRAHYFANVSMIDTQIGKIIDALAARGALDDTVILFTSDHGDCLNDHGHSQKWTMYEQSLRVPGFIHAPGGQNEGTRIDDLVSLMDFAPTILELAGVPVPSWMEGRSLCGYLDGQPQEALRDTVFAEHSDDKILDQTAFMTMIRQGDRKLVHFVDCPEGQLFDLAADPRETRNLWSDPAHADTRQHLLGEILAWRIRSSRHTQAFIHAVAEA